SSDREAPGVDVYRCGGVAVQEAEDVARAAEARVVPLGEHALDARVPVGEPVEDLEGEPVDGKASRRGAGVGVGPPEADELRGRIRAHRKGAQPSWRRKGHP